MGGLRKGWSRRSRLRRLISYDILFVLLRDFREERRIDPWIKK